MHSEMNRKKNVARHLYHFDPCQFYYTLHTHYKPTPFHSCLFVTIPYACFPASLYVIWAQTRKAHIIIYCTIYMLWWWVYRVCHRRSCCRHRNTVNIHICMIYRNSIFALKQSCRRRRSFLNSLYICFEFLWHFETLSTHTHTHTPTSAYTNRDDSVLGVWCGGVREFYLVIIKLVGLLLSDYLWVCVCALRYINYILSTK